MLPNDSEMFAAFFPGAVSFMQTASLREEYLNLVNEISRTQNLTCPDLKRSVWIHNRFNELHAHHECFTRNAPWFLDMLPDWAK